MMLYLTGARSSIKKNPVSPQPEPNKSLGGFISTTPVPNSALNSLFDSISLLSLERKTKETIAIALVNNFDFNVKNVKIKIISSPENIAQFKIAGVETTSELFLEQIESRYQEPIQAEFYNVDFNRAYVDIGISVPAISGEELYLSPFDVNIDVTESGIDGTIDAILSEFSKNETYNAKRLSEKVIRIERKDELVVTPVDCSFIASEDCELVFFSKYENAINNTAVLKSLLKPGEAIGIWIQRIIKNVNYQSNEQLIKDYNEKKLIEELEEVELIIEYEKE